MDYFKFFSIFLGIIGILFLVFYKKKNVDIKSFYPKQNSKWIFIAFWVDIVWVIYSWYLVAIDFKKFTSFFAILLTIGFIKIFSMLFFYEETTSILCSEKLNEVPVVKIRTLDFKIIDLVYASFSFFFLFLGFFVY